MAVAELRVGLIVALVGASVMSKIMIERGPMTMVLAFAVPSRPMRWLALAVVLGLSGCGDVESARQALGELGGGPKFEKATREQLASDEQGTWVRMTVVSKASASWLEADRAMYYDLAYHCRDGALYSIDSESPDASAKQLGIDHPAGTTFTRVIRCNPPPDYEFALAQGTAEATAKAMVWEKLGAKPAVEPNRHMVRVVPFSDRKRKYEAIAEVMGHLVAGRMTQCPDGMVVERLVIGAHPIPEESGGSSRHRSYAVLGVDAPCRGADVAAVAP